MNAGRCTAEKGTVRRSICIKSRSITRLTAPARVTHTHAQLNFTTAINTTSRSRSSSTAAASGPMYRLRLDVQLLAFFGLRQFAHHR